MDPLLTVPELGAALASAPPSLLLDVRWSLTGPPGREAYDRGHLPGAHFVDLDADLAARPGPGGRHPLPTVEELTATLRRLGVRAGRDVVCYDQGDAMAAARCWWTLRYLGHEHVRVLDGGYDAWVAAGGAVSVVPAEPDSEATGSDAFVAVPSTMTVLDADGAAALARSGLLLDVRSAERYRGDTEPIDPVAGHIPGARNAPATDGVARGPLRAPAELAEHLRAVGANGSAQVGVYCGSGVTAAREVLALERAGISAALYVGSWSDWITDPARPIATGGDPS